MSQSHHVMPVAPWLLLTAIGTLSVGCGVSEENDLSSADTAEVSGALTPSRVPRSIYQLTSSEKTQLANAILDFITPTVLDEHTNGHDWHHPSDPELFFVRHHNYLNQLESYLLANGYSRFVPLPTWDPGSPIPSEFLVLDPLVASAGGLNANPNLPPSSRFQFVCMEPYPSLDALATAIEGWHDQVHVRVGGAMSDPRTAPGAPIFWLWHGYLDQQYHAYERCVAARTDVTAELAPADGSYGSWRSTVYCPTGQYAVNYGMRVEGSQGSGDDTALNSVVLECRGRVPQDGGEIIASHNGLWGGWGGRIECPNANSSYPTNFLNGARLRVEGPQGGGDDTGANDATFTCNQGQTINPGGGKGWGTWSNFATCPADSAICGISIRVEDPRGSGDDTAMNGIRLKCCRL